VKPWTGAVRRIENKKSYYPPGYLSFFRKERLQASLEQALSPSPDMGDRNYCASTIVERYPLLRGIANKPGYG